MFKIRPALEHLDRPSTIEEIAAAAALPVDTVAAHIATGLRGGCIRHCGGGRYYTTDPAGRGDPADPDGPDGPGGGGENGSKGAMGVESGEDDDDGMLTNLDDLGKV